MHRLALANGFVRSVRRERQTMVVVYVIVAVLAVALVVLAPSVRGADASTNAELVAA